MGSSVGGWAGWLMRRMRGAQGAERRLAVVERVALGPRQSLALVEAEGRRILVATSVEGGPAFYPLDEGAAGRGAARSPARGATRVSW